MSIILKGIDMPDKKLMEMFESDNHICIGGNYYPLMIKDVIQIPKGHGAIKDIDTFLKEKCLYEYEDGGFVKKYICLVSTDAIHNAPTILEAEE